MPRSRYLTAHFFSFLAHTQRMAQNNCPWDVFFSLPDDSPCQGAIAGGTVAALVDLAHLKTSESYGLLRIVWSVA